MKAPPSAQNASAQTCSCPSPSSQPSPPARVSESSIPSRLSLLRKHRHLRRRTYGRIIRPNRREAHGVSEPPGDVLAPRLKLLPRPLEAMVLMPELPRRQHL